MPPGRTLPGVGSAVEQMAQKVAQLQKAATRDEVIAVLLDYAGFLASRVGLFVVQKGQLVCLDGRGPDHVGRMPSHRLLDGGRLQVLG